MIGKEQQLHTRFKPKFRKNIETRSTVSIRATSTEPLLIAHTQSMQVKMKFHSDI